MTQNVDKNTLFDQHISDLGREALSQIQLGNTNLTGKDGVLTPNVS